MSAMQQALLMGAGVTIPFSSVSLLLHCNGTDGSTTFTDSSSNSHSATAYGNMQVDTAFSQFGGASMLSDGNGDGLGFATHSTLDLSTGAFTIQFWFRSTTGTPAATRTLAGRSSNGAANALNTQWQIDLTSSGNIQAQVCGDSSGSADVQNIVGSATWSTYNDGNWHFVELNRTGDLFRFRIDGTSIGTVTVTSGILNTGSWKTGFTARPGGTGSVNTFSWNGSLDDIRIIKGACLNYTSNPSAEFSDSSVNSSGG